jgi:serine/threonine protein kinase
VTSTIEMSVCHGAHAPSTSEVGADMFVAERADSKPARSIGGSSVVALGPLAGYRLLAAPVEDEIFAVAPAVREADGLEVTVRVVVAELTKFQHRRLRNEAAELDRMLSESDNPYVLSLRDHDRDSDGRPFLVTERRGRSLSDELAAFGPLPVPQALAAVFEAAAGLDLLHQAGLTHRAVSPAALLRQPTGRVVLDCPTLLVLAELAAATSDGTGHEPPEVLLKGEDWTPRGEVYALASTLCTLVTGQSPLPGGRASRWESERDDARLDRLPAAAIGLHMTLRRALSSDPGERPSSVADFVRDMRANEGVPEAVFPQTTNLPGSREIGGYRLLSKIGSGNFGVVWRGESPDGRPVAVKVLHPHLLADDETLFRLLREGRLSLNHPNLVRVIDAIYAQGKGEAAVVMELVDGTNLQQLLADRVLGRAEGMRLLAEVADGLAAAHLEDMVHRDLKPANILMRETNGQRQALLGDFGLVKALSGPTVTQVGKTPGSPAYLAPEVIDGEAPTLASDIYALGVTAYEVLAGRRPFNGSTMHILRQHREAQPQRPVGLPDQAWAFLQSCLAKDPRRRPIADDAVVTLRELARQIALFGPDGAPAAGENDHDESGVTGTTSADPYQPVWGDYYRPGPIDPLRPDDVNLDDGVATRSSVSPPEREPTESSKSPSAHPLRRWLVLAGAVMVLAAVGIGTGILIAKSTRDDTGNQESPSTVEPQQVPVAAQLTEQGDVVTISWSSSDIKNQLGDTKIEAFYVYTVGETRVEPRGPNYFSYTDLDPTPGACYMVRAVVRTDKPIKSNNPTEVCR